MIAINCQHLTDIYDVDHHDACAAAHVHVQCHMHVELNTETKVDVYINNCK